ncbi:NUDIX hydrolase [Candidatus Sumerlaeota bacterium]|nr:NUDIX hydrolase [Candidatus Sumerlaeota bacterium]
MNKKQKTESRQYYNPSLTTDVVLIATDEKGERRVLLIKRKNPPYQGRWAFPGGFIDENETLKQCALRELEEETGVGLSENDLSLLLVADDPERDPRKRVISVVYLAQGEIANFFPRSGDDAAEVGWFPLDSPPDLAFDHALILSQAVKNSGDA